MLALALSGCGGQEQPDGVAEQQAAPQQPAPGQPGETPQQAEEVTEPISQRPWLEARERGVAFRGVGQEPGWIVEISPQRLRYIGDYGADTLAAGAPVTGAAPGDGIVHRASSSEGRSVEVTVRETPCSDTMSGERFTHEVVVRLAGRELRGCGRSLE